MILDLDDGTEMCRKFLIQVSPTQPMQQKYRRGLVDLKYSIYGVILSLDVDIYIKILLSIFDMDFLYW